MKFLFGCLLILLLSSCTSEPQSRVEIERLKLRNELVKLQYEACIKLGGVPIQSTWKEGLDSCQFPTN